ncbi:hypothetical protein PMEGAPR185_33130 [Priestia megaterium]
MPSNQLLEGTKQIKRYLPSQKNEPLINMLISGSFCSGAKILLSQPLVIEQIAAKLFEWIQKKGNG